MVEAFCRFRRFEVIFNVQPAPLPAPDFCSRETEAADLKTIPSGCWANERMMGCRKVRLLHLDPGVRIFAKGLGPGEGRAW